MIQHTSDPTLLGAPSVPTGTGVAWHGIPVRFFPLLELASEMLPLGTPDYLLEWRRDAAASTREWTLLTDWDRRTALATIAAQDTIRNLLDAAEQTIRLGSPSARVLWVVASTLWESHDPFPAGDLHGCFYLWVHDTDVADGRDRADRVAEANAKEPAAFQILGTLRQRHARAALAGNDQQVGFGVHANREQSVVHAHGVGKHRDAATRCSNEGGHAGRCVYPGDRIVGVVGSDPHRVPTLLVGDVFADVVGEDRTDEHGMVQPSCSTLTKQLQGRRGRAEGELLPRDVLTADVCAEPGKHQRLVLMLRDERRDRCRTAEYFPPITGRAGVFLRDAEVQVNPDAVRVTAVADVDHVAVLVPQLRRDRGEVVEAPGDMGLLWGIRSPARVHERRRSSGVAVAVMQHHRAVRRRAQPPRMRLHSVLNVVLPDIRRLERLPAPGWTRLPNTRHPLTVRTLSALRKDR